MSDRVGSPGDVVRNHWRVLVLVALLLASMYFLFVPGAPIAGPAAESGANDSVEGTNMQFGIDLAGGARITAPVHGHYAEDVGVTEENSDQIVQSVAAEMNVSDADVVTSHRSGEPGEDWVEVRAEGDTEAFVAGLQAAGLDVAESDVQVGVRDETREDVVTVLDQRLGESGFSGGSVTQLQERDPTQIRVETPGQDLDELESLIADRGQIRVVAHVPAENGSGAQRIDLYGQEGIQTQGTARVEGEQAFVPVTLTQEAADRKVQVMTETGFATEGTDRCLNPDDPGPNDWCIMTFIDEEVVFSGSLDSDLGQSMVDGSFSQTRQFRLTTGSNLSQANELRLNLVAGEMPTPMNLEQSSQMYISPELAEDFKLNSLIVGLIAVLAVVVVVFLRYGDPEVAAPMSATALSEVVILLGFAAAIGWPLELSHVAGFIAVIGTGVDDLVIIADEIQQQGDVSSQRVFQSRFRKAFWVIGAAAATTIVAMSPLAILNLGDLRGFAIITILGVLIGVAITRPAYGSILRHLITGDR